MKDAPTSMSAPTSSAIPTAIATTLFQLGATLFGDNLRADQIKLVARVNRKPANPNLARACQLLKVALELGQIQRTRAHHAAQSRPTISSKRRQSNYQQRDNESQRTFGQYRKARQNACGKVNARRYLAQFSSLAR